MEKWQIDHITKNLEILLQNTKCSAILKAGLKARELLTDEEDEKLTALEKTKGSINEAKLLYEIVMTRTRGYNGLMDVLRNTRQDGALAILLAGLQQQTKLQAASSESINHFMSFRFQLSDSVKGFREVFPNFTREDTNDLLQNADLKQELEEIFGNGSMQIKLDGEIPVTPDLYIPRLLSNRLQVDSQVFSLDCEDVFVFKNINRTDLTQLVKPHVTLSSTGQRSLVRGRHIYLDDEEDWDDMVAVSESPIHLISKEEEGYILQGTTQVTEVLLNYVLREDRSEEAFVTEDVFVELVSEQASNGALICDVAGMGKTWLMQSIASKIRDKNKNFVVFYIDLPSYSKFLSGLYQTTSDNHALTKVLNYVCPSKLASHLLHKYAAKNGLRIVLVFDGYDELSKDEMEIVKSNLVVFSKLDYIRMIISSRPNMRALLQKTFNLIAYDIQSFQTKDQMRCIIEQWTNAIPLADSEILKITEFARQCVQSVKSIQNSNIHDILGVPLKCRIFATVNEKQAKQLCKPNRRRSLQIVEAVTIKSVYDLYTVFVDTLVHKTAATMKLDERKDFLNEIFTFYTHLALDLLIPDLSKIYQRYHTIEGSTKERFGRTGVAFFTHSKQRLEFIHRSFAEYFVGRFFSEFWSDLDRYSPNFVRLVGSYFIKNVLVALDGEWKIHRFGNQDVLNLNRYYNCSMCLGPKKKFQLKYPLILLFMNLKANNRRFERSIHRFRNVASSFKTEATIWTKLTYIFGRNPEYDELCLLKKWLAESSFVTIVACIEERLTNILSLHTHLLISFFDAKNRVALLLPPSLKVKDVGSEKCAIWLLCRAAMSKSPETAVELFNLFGDSEDNFLSVLCQRFQEEYWSPLEVAIITEDPDMIHYFVDKVSLPFGSLFLACVSVDKKLVEPDFDAKLKIMKMVLGSFDHLMDFLCTDWLYQSSYYETNAEIITKYSFQLLLKFLEDSKRRLCSILSENKRCFLEKCLKDCNDEELVNLLSLYEKNDDKRLVDNLAAGRTFTAEVALDALDLVEVRNAFSKEQFEYLVFAKSWNLETIKVLIAIQPVFSCFNNRKWNYLHVAAYRQKIDWVTHLINSGYEIDQLDADGSTPLLCGAKYGRNELKSLLAVTRLLVENGANVYAKDRDERNVAHYVFKDCFNADSKDLCEWVSYTLDNGYHQLWEMTDILERTPQEILIKEAGKDSQMTIDVLRLLQSYSVVSRK